MPELPEVEVTRIRLERELRGRRFTRFVSRVQKLRLPVPAELAETLPGQLLHGIERRGKYLLFRCGNGLLLVHLGMTGFLRVQDGTNLPGKHDHIDFEFDCGKVLRFHDPRKFGIVTWFDGDPAKHPLLAEIGPEPLSESFDAAYLFAVTRRKNTAVKQLLMNSTVVAGVGNIYANEALFGARIRPDRRSVSLSMHECAVLVSTLQQVLGNSIRDGSAYRIAAESVAYHPQKFNVYGRKGQACCDCGTELVETRLGNRSTVYCLNCQR